MNICLKITSHFTGSPLDENFYKLYFYLRLKTPASPKICTSNKFDTESHFIEFQILEIEPNSSTSNDFTVLIFSFSVNDTDERLQAVKTACVSQQMIFKFGVAISSLLLNFAVKTE